MSKVKINPEKLHVADGMHPTQDQGRIVYAKQQHEEAEGEEKKETNAAAEKDAAAQ